MAINLQKGQKIDLTKGNAGLTKLLVGLGWDPVENPKKSCGLLKSLFGGGSSKPNFDCDASVFMLDEKGKYKDLVYFGNLKSPCGSIQHQGDNLTGQGEGDDEQILVDLSKVPSDTHRLVFVVNIYDAEKRKQDFGMISNAFIRIVNQANNQELLKFNLSENYAGKTTLIAGEVYKHNGEWKFAALGESTTDIGLKALAQRYA